MNTISIIHPYRYNGTWVFDDAQHGLLHEPFVAGADTLIDRAVADIPNAAEGFNLIFSAGPFPGHQFRLQHRRREFDGIGTTLRSSMRKGGSVRHCFTISRKRRTKSSSRWNHAAIRRPDRQGKDLTRYYGD
jgi:hypothetical protein